MLAREKRNMFISFRNEPRDLQSIGEEIKLNVRRGLAKLNDNKDTKNDAEHIPLLLNELKIEDLTSIDIYKDQRAHFRAHEWRMRDVVYTKKFWKAICCNSHLFKDKIVLNVNCDLGILSMFSAIAGAKHVYAIDDSDIVQLTRRVIVDNNLSDKITVIKGKVADISLPVANVDIIVSTSFGQSIFCDNKLDELIDARDKWLVTNGLIFPDRCSLYIAALSNRHSLDRSNFWQHVHSFDMRPMIRAVTLEPYLQDVPLEQVVTNACPIKHVNMYTVQKRDFKRFDAPFRLEMGRTTTSIGAFLTFFDIEFTEGVLPITFSIQPGWPQTFWKPLIFFLSIDDLEVGGSETFYGVFRMNTLSDDYRKIDWNIEVMYQSQRSRFRDQWNFQTR